MYELYRMYNNNNNNGLWVVIFLSGCLNHKLKTTLWPGTDWDQIENDNYHYFKKILFVHYVCKTNDVFTTSAQFYRAEKKDAKHK